ncbi:Hpt domain-containing protein [uncultured Ruegeria sp.]|uniref:Hpt domain-containing protein n=1 Tax=uncultured Ruegeria sp. TaxID=259304 RepID=UPI0026274962|nr:Hpt domain-containing protein [uncultured Ruegeria sp.]
MIHWTRVRQLRNEVGPSEFEEVVQIFLEEVQEVITRLHQDTRRVELEQNLHFLKGSALSLGFDQFSRLCQDGERQAAAGQGADVDLPAILAVFESSKTVFEAELKQNLR